MKSLLCLLLLFVASLSLAQIDISAPGELLVKFKPGATSNRKAASRMLGAREVQEFRQIGAVRVQLPQGVPLHDAAAYYEAFADAVYAEPNYLRQLHRVPNDTDYFRQYGPKKVQMEPAWDLSTGASNVTIAVLDTGVDLKHPDLQGKLVPGKDFSDNDDDPTDMDGHGTHCVGNIGAATNNRQGIAGIAYNCRVMPIKIFPNAFSSVVIRAVTYAADNNVKVISMSFGGAPPSQAEEDAMNYAWSKGVVLVASAGNDGRTNVNYPAGYANVVSVGASDQNDQRADFSTHGDWVRVTAPGVNILSTLPGGYGGASGTSMSAPIVAGVAGLCFAYGGPSTKATAVRAAIEGTCDNVGPWVHFGRINALKALKAVSPPVEFSFGPNAVSMDYGQSFNGGLSAVQSSDNVRYSVVSRSSNLGQIAATAMTFRIDQPLADMQALQLRVEAQAISGSTHTLFLYNWNTKAYEFARSFGLSASDQSQTMAITPGSAYISPTGEVKAVSRVNVGGSSPSKKNSPFNFRIDQVRLVGTFRSSG